MQSSSLSQDFRIVVILFIIIIAVLFIHSLIRLVLMIVRNKRRKTAPASGKLRTEDGDFVTISHPIPVILARDEELGLSGTEVPPEKMPSPPPPAYGYLRGSVVSPVSRTRSNASEG